MRRGPLVSAAVVAVLAVAAAGFTWEALRPDHDELVVEVTATATPPIPATQDATVVWTGEEFVVWGGGTGDKVHGGVRDEGAAYDPATDTWRPMADAPRGTDRSSGQAVMLDGDVVIGGGYGPSGREETRVLRYDLDADRWETFQASAQVVGRLTLAVEPWDEEPSHLYDLDDVGVLEPTEATTVRDLPAPVGIHAAGELAPIVSDGSRRIVLSDHPGGPTGIDLATGDVARVDGRTPARALCRNGAARAIDGTRLLLWGGWGCSVDEPGDQGAALATVTWQERDDR